MPVAHRLWVLAVLLVSFSAVAQQDDARQQEEADRKAKFRAGFGVIVNDLNQGSTGSFVRALDREAILERTFGLRLIDPKVKEQFRNDFDNIIDQTFGRPAEAEASMEPIRVAWLGIGSKGDRGKAILRQDLADFQFNYYEYELRLDERGNVRIVDFVDFLEGDYFTNTMGETLIKQAPGKNAVRKLIDFQSVSDTQLFQMTELLKASRDMKVDRFFEIYNAMDPQLQRQRVALLSGVQVCKLTRDRRKLRTVLQSLAQYYPDEPLYALMLLDYYFPTRQYEQAMDTLLRLQKRLGVKDAAMSARLSSAALVLRDADSASAYAEEAVGLEPGLELAWWSALRARTASGQFAQAVEALDVLETDFGYTLDSAGLEKDPSLGALLGSEAYGEWSLARGESGETAD